MRFKFAAAATALAVALGLLTAQPAQAQLVQTPNTDSSVNATGFIVKYKSGVAPIAPNGEPTGENFAGVDLENSRDLGGRFKAVDFAADLSDGEALQAKSRLEADPRVESVEFDRFVETASVAAKPIAASILGKSTAIESNLIIRDAVRRATVTSVAATDAWLSEYTERVKVSWAKPTVRYSGSILGYRVQIYASGTWKTLKSQTYASTRTYTTSTTYLKAGTSSRFRVAAITKYYGRVYVGYYGYAEVVPTTKPRLQQVLSVVNEQSSIAVSWTPYTSEFDKGGLPVSYLVTVTKPDTSVVGCDPGVQLNRCSVTDLVQGTTYKVVLNISNSRGSVTITKNILFTSSTVATASLNPDYSKQWFLNANQTYSAKVSTVWARETGLESIVVAVVDTGYTVHPDIEPSRILPGYDLIMSPTSANDNSCTISIFTLTCDSRDSNALDAGDYVGNTPSSWHGTHVMGIIGASDNQLGVMGVAPHVKLLPVRVLGAEGGSVSDIVAGINWALGRTVDGTTRNQNPANVINLSIGGDSVNCDSATEEALDYAKTHGVTVITAAGNDNGDSNLGHLPYASLSYPGNCYPTINVGSSGQNGRPAFYSNFSNAGTDATQGEPYGVDVSAPGGDYCQGGANAQIYSTLNDGTTSPGNGIYRYEIGTSMAAPVVAGIVALLYSAKKRQNSSFVFNEAFVLSMYRAIIDTASPFASTTPLNCASTGKTSITNGANYGGYGSGIVNAEAALTQILQ
jgi:serine protease